jgi:hypothetical protein
MVRHTQGLGATPSSAIQRKDNLPDRAGSHDVSERGELGRKEWRTD